MGESSLSEVQSRSCTSCGAPLEGNRCKYCNTPYIDTTVNQSGQTKPPTQAERERQEDEADLELAFKAMGRLKRAKGDEEAAKRWENSGATESKKSCSKCGADNRLIANFCAQCGNKF